MTEDARIDLDRYVMRAKLASAPAPEGRIAEIVGMLVEVDGISAAVGSQLEARTGDRKVMLEVMGFRNGRMLAAPLGSLSGLTPGARVRPSHGTSQVPAGTAL